MVLGMVEARKRTNHLAPVNFDSGSSASDDIFECWRTKSTFWGLVLGIATKSKQELTGKQLFEVGVSSVKKFYSMLEASVDRNVLVHC
jgi:hypothetical protein